MTPQQTRANVAMSLLISAYVLVCGVGFISNMGGESEAEEARASAAAVVADVALASSTPAPVALSAPAVEATPAAAQTQTQTQTSDVERRLQNAAATVAALQAANDRLQAQIDAVRATVAVLPTAPQSAAIAATPVAPQNRAAAGIAAVDALLIVKQSAPQALVRGVPRLVTYRGSRAWRVTTSQGALVISARTGKVLFNGTSVKQPARVVEPETLEREPLTD